MLDLDGQNEEGAMLVTASPTEIRAACEYMSTDDATPVTNLEKFAFASASASASTAIAQNKAWVYRQNAHGIPRNVTDEYAHLLPLTLNNALSKMRSTT
jgi:hypothetical protein